MAQRLRRPRRQPVAGTATDGTYTQTCSIPAAVSNGEYQVWIHASDVVGNTRNAADSTFTVTGGSSDVAAPVVASVTHEPAVTAGNTITLTWRLTDASGVTFTTASIKTSNGVWLSGCGGPGVSLSSGTATDGTYTQTCTIPDTSPDGTYSVWVEAADVAGNTRNAADSSFIVSHKQGR